MILHKLSNPRQNGRQQIDYTMALDKIEFVAIQCAVQFVLDTIKSSENPFTNTGFDLALIYEALNMELHHPSEW